MKLLDNIKEPVTNAFFKKLNYSDDYESMKPLSMFLIEVDKNNFITSYCKALLAKYKNKQNSEFIENFKLLSDEFREIDSINNILMDEVNSEIVSKQIKLMIVIEIKGILTRVLLNYENKFKNENLYSCCKLYLYLNDEELKNLFQEFLENIETIIFNLFNNFFHSINEIKKPIKSFHNEEIIILTYKIIKNMDDRCFDDFFRRFREDLDFKNYEQLKLYLGNLLTNKVFENSEQLKGIQKDVYLINNLHLLQCFYKIHNKKRLIEYIDSFSNEIIQIWSSECKKRGKDEFTRFLDVNLEIQKNYFVPEELRDMIQKKVKEIINNNVKEKAYKNSTEVLNLKLDELFTGKRE
ncbi:hypothetical protein COBT_002449 [Conglomerata obtusa]